MLGEVSPTLGRWWRDGTFGVSFANHTIGGSEGGLSRPTPKEHTEEGVDDAWMIPPRPAHHDRQCWEYDLLCIVGIISRASSTFLSTPLLLSVCVLSSPPIKRPPNKGTAHQTVPL